ncbi:hypothetical protein GCM10023203_51510 [Actinomycetospora straminea]|uniref:Uncharacterized protein n=1 Tax=Actinomycetospora straminea TaxID=663607 RepID=A0ABP9F231_9PSEU
MGVVAISEYGADIRVSRPATRPIGRRSVWGAGWPVPCAERAPVVTESPADPPSPPVTARRGTRTVTTRPADRRSTRESVGLWVPDRPLVALRHHLGGEGSASLDPSIMVLSLAEVILCGWRSSKSPRYLGFRSRGVLEEIRCR